jgi:hypothetical protein
MGIAAWREEIRRAGLDEADRCTYILDLAGEREQRRKSTLGVRLKEVGQKRHTVSKHDLDIVRRRMPTRTGSTGAYIVPVDNLIQCD